VTERDASCLVIQELRQVSNALIDIHVGVPQQHPVVNSLVNVCLIAAEEGALFNSLDPARFCISGRT